MKKDADAGGSRGGHLLGLRRALADCPGLDDEVRRALDAVKKVGTELFAPELGGSYEVWEHRQGCGSHRPYRPYCTHRTHCTHRSALHLARRLKKPRARQPLCSIRLTSGR
jgi:hypothetical protein